MKREELLAKGYTEEQVTDLLNTFHKVNEENKILTNELGKKSELEAKNLELQKQLDEINKASMTEQERIAKEKEEIAKNLKDSRIIKNTALAKDILAGMEVDDKLVKRLVSEDENETVELASLFKTKLDNDKEKHYKEAKESLINANVTPTPTNVPQNDDSMTVEKFNSMTLTEQVMWKKENAQEYENLMN